MAKVTKEEIKKIAELTRVSFNDEELDGIMQQFNDVISYAERVVQIAQQAEQIISVKNINADRPDVMIPTDSAKILAQAPASEDNYFVVPKFLDN
jgi:aspartyl-tRNA(Asn)/glutamyl-tRNA(Gln) amidotransferase subunit C